MTNKSLLLLYFSTIVLHAGSQTFDWAKTCGSWAYDYSYAIATDVNGYNYITGYFQDTAYFGSNMIVSAGDNDVFVAKYDKFGNCLWARQAGSVLAPDQGYAIALDNASNCYITGFYIDTIDFGSQQLNPLGWDDMFIAKYDASGIFQWAKRYGGTSNDDGKGIAVDAAGNIYVSGYFWGAASFDSYNLSSAGWGDVFTAKFDASGTCQWAQRGGGAGDDEGLAVCVDNSGNVFSTGFFKNTATFGTNNLTSAGVEDIFIAKYDATGNLQWVKQAGNTGTDIGYAIASDASGNCYVTGYFNGSITMGSFTLNSTGANEIFIAKLDPAGNYLWAIQDGGVLNDEGYGIVLDDAGYLYLTGSFEGFTTIGNVELNSMGIGDIFVACYSTDSIFQWAKQAGGTNQDDGFAVGVDT
ncbi:MAG: SBBP repeat-containing protein, partial [Flavobacteriales bacterium]